MAAKIIDSVDEPPEQQHALTTTTTAVVVSRRRRLEACDASLEASDASLQGRSGGLAELDLGHNQLHAAAAAAAAPLIQMGLASLSLCDNRLRTEDLPPLAAGKLSTPADVEYAEWTTFYPTDEHGCRWHVRGDEGDSTRRVHGSPAPQSIAAQPAEEECLGVSLSRRSWRIRMFGGQLSQQSRRMRICGGQLKPAEPADGCSWGSV